MQPCKKRQMLKRTKERFVDVNDREPLKEWTDKYY